MFYIPGAGGILKSHTFPKKMFELQIFQAIKLYKNTYAHVETTPQLVKLTNLTKFFVITTILPGSDVTLMPLTGVLFENICDSEITTALRSFV